MNNKILCVTLFLLMPMASLAANNLFIIEEDAQNGFVMYRSGSPDQTDVAEFCELGIQEIMVLSGNADQAEWKFQNQCPTLKVIYNVDQDSKTPLDKKFLDFFDSWVLEAKVQGKKIAFRCDCGCHRTGRLAGYYQMKYQKLTYADAAMIMTDHGKFMGLFSYLYEQLKGLEDYIHGRPCSVEAKYCVRE
ncbi:MAG: dual specificity protein phosphatase family protein [Deltaproteobacteria bacterium]|nr:dual specificity protein phosphatase family protein [Deltaproteobacteria bacterium]